MLLVLLQQLRRRGDRMLRILAGPAVHERRWGRGLVLSTAEGGCCSLQGAIVNGDGNQQRHSTEAQ